MEATLTSKGQITMPKEIRERLDLKTGDKIHFVLLDDGTLYVLPVNRSLKDLQGIVPKPERALTIEEMNEAIAQGVMSRVRD
jgi:AbrB family looped-hinge helix DNA binding protein